MSEGCFSAIVLCQILVDDASVLIEQLNRNASLRGGGRHTQTRFHIFDDLCGGTAKGNDFDAFIELMSRLFRTLRRCWCDCSCACLGNTCTRSRRRCAVAAHASFWLCCACCTAVLR